MVSIRRSPHSTPVIARPLDKSMAWPPTNPRRPVRRTDVVHNQLVLRDELFGDGNGPLVEVNVELLDDGTPAVDFIAQEFGELVRAR